MSLKETLNVVLGKLVPQATNVALAQKDAETRLQQASPEAVEAAKVLIKEFGNPQGATQILQSVYQVDALKDTLDEINAMIAGIQATVVSPDKLLDADVQLAANTGAANNPLPQPGAVGSPGAVADAGTSSEAAPTAA